MPDFWNINRPQQVTAPSPSLPLYDQEQTVPFHLVVQDRLRAFTEEMREAIVPKRVFYDEYQNVYIYADLHTYPIQIYFIRGDEAHSMLGSVLLAWTESWAQKLGQAALYDTLDFCIHKTPLGIFKFSLLLCNKATRHMSVLRFKVSEEELTTPSSVSPDYTHYQLTDRNLDFIGNIVHNKVYDEMAITSQTNVAVPPLYIPRGTRGGFTHTMPNVAEIVPKLHQHLYIGDLNYKYCGLTCTELGQYIILVQSTIKVWVSPFLHCPVDVQYAIIMDEHGMTTKWILLGPTDSAVNFNETTLGQPYYYNPMVVEGRVLVCAQHRKRRFMRPAVSLFRSTNIDPPHTWYEVPIGATQWVGGWRADLFYPHYYLSGRHQGYVTTWEAPEGLTPIYQETTWMRVDIRSLIKNADSLPALNSIWRRISFQHHSYQEQFPTQLTVWDTHATTFLENYIVRFSIDPVLFFEQHPDTGATPQSSITLNGVLPGNTETYTYYLKNNSYTMRLCRPNIIVPEDLPDGVTISVAGLPEELGPCPGQTVPFTITVTYDPPVGVSPKVNFVIPVQIEYFLIYAQQVTELTLSPSSVEGTPGAVLTFTPTLGPSTACSSGMPLQWLTSDNSRAVVHNAAAGQILVVTSAQPGMVDVTVKEPETGLSAKAVISIFVPVTGVTVTPTQTILRVGQTQQCIASILPSYASTTAVTWASADISIVSVNMAGLVTGVAPKMEEWTDVTVTTIDGGYTAISQFKVASSTRAFFTGYVGSVDSANIGVIHFDLTESRAALFGTLITRRYYGAAAGDGTRAFFMGGIKHAVPSRINTIESTPMAGASSISSFGTLTQYLYYQAAAANSYRVIISGGSSSATATGSSLQTDNIEYFDTASATNASNWGEVAPIAHIGARGCGSPTLAVFFQGYPVTGSAYRSILCATYATLGNLSIFGELPYQTATGAALSTETQGISVASAYLESGTPLEYRQQIWGVTFSTLANATQFGLLSEGLSGGFADGCSNGISGLICNSNSTQTVLSFMMPTGASCQRISNLRPSGTSESGNPTMACA